MEKSTTDIQRMDKQSAPKFSSFKPKVLKETGVKAYDNSPSERRTSPRHDRGQHRSHNEEDKVRHYHHRQHRRQDSDSHYSRRKLSRDRHHHQSPHKSGPELSSSPSTSALVQREELEEPSAFVFDHRGDTKNVEYGSLHRYSIPNYHRSGYGRILGTPGPMKIDRNASSGNMIVLIPLTTNFASHEGKETKERLLIQKQPNDMQKRLKTKDLSAGNPEFTSDFLYLRPNSKRKHAARTINGTCNEDDVNYRSLEDRPKTPLESEDEDLDFDSNVSDASFSLHEKDQLEAQRQSATLYRRAKRDTWNVNAWIDLIEHQSKLLYPNTAMNELSNSDRSKLAAARVALYEEANRDMTQNHPEEERLLLGMMREVSFIFGSSHLAEKWSKTIKDCPNSYALRIAYIDFLQSDPAEFRFEKCKKAYIQCLEMLQTSLAAAKDATKRTELQNQHVYVLLRLTAFIRGAGYDELANSIWQIVLEYAMLDSFEVFGYKTSDEILGLLEEFWESNVPRIGEEGAVALRHFIQHGAGSAQRNVGSVRNEYSDNLPTTAKVWADKEMSILGQLHLPITGDDEDVERETDPFNYVLFSDLRPIIACVLTFGDNKSEILKTMLFNAWLCFMGLPPLPNFRDKRSEINVGSWWTDPYLTGTEMVWGAARVSDSENLMNYDYSLPRNESETVFSLCLGHAFRSFYNRINSLGKAGEAISPFVSHTIERAVSTIYRQIDREGYFDIWESLAEYWLSFSLNMLPIEVPKIAKRLLKACPQSLRTYNAFALAELKQEKREKAEEVWRSALSLVNSLEQSFKAPQILLWHSWMMALVNHGEERRALGVLNIMPDHQSRLGLGKSEEVKTSAVVKLKVERYLDEGFERMTHQKMPGYAALYSECMAWGTYLSSDCDLEIALQLLDKYFQKLLGRGYTRDDSAVLEVMHQARAYLISHHITVNKRPYKPLIVEKWLVDSLRQYPSNTALLDLHNQIFRNQGRLRAVLQQTANLEDIGLRSQAPNLMQSWFTVTQEIRRYGSAMETSGSTAESVRSLFKRAILGHDSPAKCSVWLWTQWYLFELEREQQGRLAGPSLQNLPAVHVSMAKQVFLDGLRCLPWCKAWVVMGMRHLLHVEVEVHARGGIVQQELGGVLDILEARELRARISTDKVGTGG